MCIIHIYHNIILLTIFVDDQHVFSWENLITTFRRCVSQSLFQRYKKIPPLRVQNPSGPTFSVTTGECDFGRQNGRNIVGRGKFGLRRDKRSQNAYTARILAVLPRLSPSNQLKPVSPERERVSTGTDDRHVSGDSRERGKTIGSTNANEQMVSERRARVYVPWTIWRRRVHVPF